MLEYQIVEEGSVSSLEATVRRRIAAGWILLGGVAVAFTDGGSIRGVYQAMIRHPQRNS